MRCPFGYEVGDPPILARCPLGFPGCSCADAYVILPREREPDELAVAQWWHDHATRPDLDG